MEEHDENYARSIDPINQILKRIKDYDQAIRLYKKVRKEGSVKMYMGWKPPKRSMIKLNMDDARKDNKVAECGGILTDHKGDWRCGFSKYLKNCSAIYVEFWRVFKDLKLTKSLGFSKLENNVASLQVIKTIKDGEVGHIECASILRRIKEIISTQKVVVIMHAYRNLNVCADALENRWCMKKNFIIYL
ncbi:uncharacterized protein LOC131613166 [Vicia villosa]|uniref:uncharacterized protein LOC131613166 n=1 Tax=Vicia villosa TaxID=3911 RepID=UPI00273B795C|nr:uncharacterized protein LOC131613166 [Vicia villosa]